VLLYRTWIDVAPGHSATVGQTVAGWLADKTGLDASDLVDPGTHEVTDRCTVQIVAAPAGGTPLTRWRLIEAGEQTFTTTIWAAGNGKGQAVAVDVDMTTTIVGAAPTKVYAPRVVASLLEAVPASRGGIPLHPTPQFVVPDDAGGFGDVSLLTWSTLRAQMIDPVRDLPIVLLAPAGWENPTTTARRAEQVTRRVAGLAHVHLLHPDAADALRGDFGGDMRVDPGTIRTYQPGLGADRDGPWRHRFVPPRLMAQSPNAAVDRVAGDLGRAAAATMWPAMLTDAAATLIDDQDVTDLLDDVDRDNRQLTRDLAAAEAQIAQDADALAALQAELNRVTRERDWLRQTLTDTGRGEAAWAGPPEPDLPDSVESVEEALAVAEAYLDRIVLPAGIDAHTDALDSNAQAPSWAMQTYRALRDLNAYATAKADGTFDGSYYDWCASGQGNWPVSGYSATESPSVGNNPKWRRTRMLPIDPATHADVDRDGLVYMQAHIKISGSSNAVPRIHLYDDTRGPTKKVHVGYVGPHLPNTLTN
jgi:hypothetical protein